LTEFRVVFGERVTHGYALPFERVSQILRFSHSTLVQLFHCQSRHFFGTRIYVEAATV
jgi:hypothetical protein